MIVLENSGAAGSAGALVYDDFPIDPAAQVIYYAFALSALSDQNQAEALVVNAVTHLLDKGLPTGVEDDPGDRAPSTPQIARLVGMAPNPFNGGTVVRIEMVHTGSAQLDIYDVRGRRVRRLSDDGRTLAPGLHEFPWDGRNNRGHYVSSGVYFVRLSAGGEVESGKLVLVK
jgi:hypothetical protein